MATDHEMMDGVEISNVEEQGRPLLTDDEKRILEVYDRLEELQFEIALLRARGVLSQGESQLVMSRFQVSPVQMNLKMKCLKKT